MGNSLSRREILKLGGLSLGSLAFKPFKGKDPDNFSPADAVGLTRVTIDEVKIYSQPSYQSEPVGAFTRDQLVYVYKKINSPQGPDFNPRWYRVEGGYAHTAYLQPVETSLNKPLYSIPEGGLLGEITVPVTQSFRSTKMYGWQLLYRMYYRSVHWITGVNYGPTLVPWYEITDDLLKVTYWVMASHVRIISADEITPISPDVPFAQKRIEVSIDEQHVVAYERDKPVLTTKVSTGIAGIGGDIPSYTPRGDFNVQIKMPVRHMGDGALTSDINAYELPGVPWVSFFVDTGVAFHGTYWHDNYGNEMSHGCVNMRPDDAKWLWRWITPVTEKVIKVQNGYGTMIEVI